MRSNVFRRPTIPDRSLWRKGSSHRGRFARGKIAPSAPGAQAETPALQGTPAIKSRPAAQVLRYVEPWLCIEKRPDLSGADNYIVKSGGLAIAPKPETVSFLGDSTQIERHLEFVAI